MSRAFRVKQLLRLEGLPVKVRVQTPGRQQTLDVINALVARTFEVFDSQTHFLVGVVEFARTAAGVPLRSEAGENLRDAAEIRTITAPVGTRIRSELDVAPGNTFLHEPAH